jgi:hypothetical protein
MLPNDTDLTVFREDGNIDGYNFAFIDDHFDYHTAQDSYERLDKNTLEHQATYLMPLLNYFANADLTNLKSDTDYVYFNIPIIGILSILMGFTIINYHNTIVFGARFLRNFSKKNKYSTYVQRVYSFFIILINFRFICLLRMEVFKNYSPSIQ